mmetsp:Transcript_8871/g.13168  ORF Transcript_8871/g.13168 Transcript_8871/m.13168 type:complete len:530 (-) Transcript_8871:55-1644(-)
MSVFKNVLNNSTFKAVKNTVMQIGPIEAKVREATSQQTAGTNNRLKQEIAQWSFDYENCRIILETIRRRMGETGKQYRHVQKSLQLLEHLLLNGSDLVLDVAKSSDWKFQIRSLKSYQAYDEESHKEVGKPTRDAAIRVLRLVKDAKHLKAERKKAKDLARRMEGTSSASSRFGGASSSSYSRSSRSGGKGTSSRSYGYDDSDSDSDEGVSYTPKKKKSTTASSSSSSVKKTSAKKKSLEWREDSGDEDDYEDTQPAKKSNIRVRSSSISKKKSAPRVVKAEPREKTPPVKQENLLDMDDFFSTPTPQQTAPQQSSSSGFSDDPFGEIEQQPAQQRDDFADDDAFGNDNFGNDNFGNDGKDAFADDAFGDDDFGQQQSSSDNPFENDVFGDDQFQEGNKSAPNQNLFDMTKDLVDLNLNETNKPQSKQSMKMNKKKSLNERRREQSGIMGHTGRKTVSRSTIPSGGYPPRQPQYPPQQQTGYPPYYPPQQQQQYPPQQQQRGGYPQQYPPQQQPRGYPPQQQQSTNPFF